MPIIVTCSCGQKLKVRDELAGSAGRCPKCQAVLRIPTAEPDLAPLDNDPLATAALESQSLTGRPVALSSPRRRRTNGPSAKWIVVLLLIGGGVALLTATGYYALRAVARVVSGAGKYGAAQSWPSNPVVAQQLGPEYSYGPYSLRLPPGFAQTKFESTIILQRVLADQRVWRGPRSEFKVNLTSNQVIRGKKRPKIYEPASSGVFIELDEPMIMIERTAVSERMHGNRLFTCIVHETPEPDPSRPSYRVSYITYEGATRADIEISSFDPPGSPEFLLLEETIKSLQWRDLPTPP
jgi:hypothetical protein